ncbi:PRC-barrel domain-containing protein [Streptomyces sp. NPDC008150]|uniref:PRC-barrel domain-containing protein n=1 Tax=Streptomyces sp. NPDC008150 TaxID=3364816 RepID=UPI0036E156E9
MTLFSQMRGLPVLTLTDAVEIGVVRSVTLDVATGTLTHLHVGPDTRKSRRKESVLPWEALHAVGADAVLLRADAPPAPGPDGSPDVPDAVGLRVLTEGGEERGTVRDLSFDPESGRLDALITSLGQYRPDRLLGLGDYALVVRSG